MKQLNLFEQEVRSMYPHMENAQFEKSRKQLVDLEKRKIKKKAQNAKTRQAFYYERKCPLALQLANFIKSRGVFKTFGTITVRDGMKAETARRLCMRLFANSETLWVCEKHKSGEGHIHFVSNLELNAQNLRAKLLRYFKRDVYLVLKTLHSGNAVEYNTKHIFKGENKEQVLDWDYIIYEPI